MLFDIIVDSVKESVISDGFKAEDFFLSILVKAITDQKTKERLTRAKMDEIRNRASRGYVERSSNNLNNMDWKRAF